jgi:uncharacterized Zn-binding protein involved in type VI secretion
MPAAARENDNAEHDSPHCHAPIHPAVPTPTPLAHSPVSLPIVSACATNVLINNLAAAVVGSQTQTCMLPSCVPGGPGVVAMGSATVMMGGKPAARVGDMVAFASCVAPIPSPTGKILAPGSPTVIIGG